MLKSIIKDNETLRKAFIARRKELGLTQDALAKEAARLGRPEIRRMSINRYERNHQIPGILNEDQILFLSAYLDINVSLLVDGFKNKYNINRAYDRLSKYEGKKISAPKEVKKKSNPDIEEIKPFKK